MATKNKGNGVCHTEQSKAPPGSPSMSRPATSWPAPGKDVGLKQDRQKGKNRDRNSFKSGSQW